MKKIIIFLTLIFIITACQQDNFLERESTTSVSEERVFENAELIKLFVNNMYADIPNFERNLYDNITDESTNFWTQDHHNVRRGDWYPDNNPMKYWAYKQVRKTNMFLARIDDSPVAEKEALKMKGEVKFLRAKLYFDMVKRYGGVPLVTTPQTLDDDLFVKRSTMDECFTFIIKELEEAITLLPESHGSRAVDVGKANKWSAKAFLGRVLLFYASPLYNPQNDAARWTKAAQINKEVIDSGVYDLFPNFRNIMLEKNNVEEVFSVQFQYPYKHHGWDSWAQPDSRSRQDASERCPYQEFVDAFEMANGKRITDPTSGYDPQNPYENRDPRLDQTVILNGTPFGLFQDPVYFFIGEGSTWDQINNPYGTVTGYLMRKGTEELNDNFYGQSGSDQNWPELRYAEILLNYAEAMNEASGSPDQSVYNAVERIRQRAGLDPYQLPSGLTKDQMRETIQHERYIELAFEQKRYWDLRRWKIMRQVMDGKTFTAMYIYKESDGSYRYDPQPLKNGACRFDEHMYFMPIPQSEMNKNPNLEQNPGW